jgi:hypothetical protein
VTSKEIVQQSSMFQGCGDNDVVVEIVVHFQQGSAGMHVTAYDNIAENLNPHWQSPIGL